MTLPANAQQAAVPWGADAVVCCWGPEGGPYHACDTINPLPVNIVAGSAANAAAGATGSAVPASADYVGLNVGGTLRGQTGVNPSGSVYAGQVDVASVGGTAVGAAVPVTTQPATSGGCSPYRTLDLQPGGAVVKGSAGQVYGYYLANQASAVRYVKVYDKATTPTSGDTPVLTIALPANSAANVSVPQGLAFANGIGLRGTTGVADGDTGAPAANDVIANVWYR